MNIGALIADGALWVAVPLAVLAGLVSFASPCILPLVPGYLGYLGGAVTPQQERISATVDPASPHRPESGPRGTAVAVEDAVVTRSRLLPGVLLFIAGFTAVFITVNVIGSFFGSFFLEYADVLARIMGVFVIALGLAFLGFFRFTQHTVRPQFRQRMGVLGAPLLGIALGIGWTPCIGPTLAAIFAVSWNLGDPARAAVLGLAYSLGLGIPFVLLALGFGWATRSVAFVRRHIRAVHTLGGAMLILLGLLMVTGLWTALMSQLQGVFLSVPLPI